LRESRMREIRTSGLTRGEEVVLRHRLLSYSTASPQGVSLKTIGDALGHRDSESTADYLRLVADDLSEVGLPVPRAASPVVLPKPDWKNLLPRVRFGTGPHSSPPTRFRSGLGASMQRYIATVGMPRSE
jgi:hypothetical protein